MARALWESLEKSGDHVTACFLDTSREEVVFLTPKSYVINSTIFVKFWSQTKTSEIFGGSFRWNNPTTPFYKKQERDAPPSP